MKKIFFGTQIKNGRLPFWHPWGFMGCLGRLLLFLLLLLLLLFLLSLFRRCDHDGSRSIRGSDRGGGNRSDTTWVSWNQPIENGEEVGLPAPEDNVLPSFEETVPNPDNDGATEIYPNLLYVILDSETDDETFKQFAQKFSSLYPAPHHKIQYYNTGSKTAVLVVPEDKRTKICQELPNQIPDVKFLVVPVEVMTQYASPLVTPNDPAFRDVNKSWYFKPIQAQEAWGITRGSSDVIVGIVDSYMDLNHPELKGDRCIYPYSVVKGNSDVSPRPGAPQDYAGHGTLVTSVAVGNANNGAGSSGIAPLCKFIPVSMGEQINTITEVEGLLYCMYHGATVINLSCGANFPNTITQMPLDQQIAFSEHYGKPQEKMWDYVYQLAEKHNVTIVWAAGNSNCFAAMDVSKRNANTIRVSAVDRSLKRANFSNYGNFAMKRIYASTISAPGVDIWGALPNNQYAAWPGTSFSAPIITGVVALLKSQNKNLTTRQIIQILQETGKPIAASPEIGKLVQIKDALERGKRTPAGRKRNDRRA